MIQSDIEIVNKLGLHARAAAKLVSTAGRFSSRIDIKFGDQTSDAKSIMGMMMLAASKGSLITISAEGKDEQDALEAISTLINNYFDEEE